MEHSQRHFTPEEAADLLRDATTVALAQKQLRERTLSFGDVVAMANELGLERASVERVLLQRAAEQLHAQRRADAKAAVETARRAKHLDQIKVRAVQYAFILGALAVVNVVTSTTWWAQWAALVFCVVLAIEARRSLRSASDESAHRK